MQRGRTCACVIAGMLTVGLAAGCRSGRDDGALWAKVGEYNQAVDQLNEIGSRSTNSPADIKKGEALEERILTMRDEIEKDPSFAKKYKLGRPAASLKGSAIAYIEPVD